MPNLKRSGFTLVELLIAMVLFGLVAAGIYKVLVGHQRLYQAQTQRIDLQQNVRAGVAILPAEFRELDASEGDISAMSATSITIRAMRQFAVLCNQPALGVGNPIMIVRDRPFYGIRNFDPARDSILVYYEGDEATRNDDSWLRGRATAVGAGVCPDGTVGRTLTTALVFGNTVGPSPAFTVYPQINQTGRVQIGSPIRGFESVTYGLYQTGGEWFVGLNATGTGGMQPLIGPVTSTGLEMIYRDSTGAVTNNPLRVGLIEIHLRAMTARQVRMPDGQLTRPVDSVTTVVALRNNRRF